MEGEAISSFTIGKLHDLLVKERVFLQALSTCQVDELAETLAKMEELLEYAHIRRDKRVADIIELADILTDSIEIYVFRVVNKHTGFRERLLRPKVSLAIESITTEVLEFVNSRSGDLQTSSSSSSIASSCSRRAYKFQDHSGYNEKDFIGREEDVNKLVSYLVNDHEDEQQHRVISIHGMGGLGKTMLARKVYKEKKVLSHFQSFAFVCVSEQCQAEEILKHILQQLVRDGKEEIKSMVEADVIESLQRVQGAKKCLVIIDDIWSVRDWESLNRGLLPDGGCTGSKVLITTQIKDVAEKGFCYSLKCLSEDECWDLFRKTIFTSQDFEVEKRREELGRRMIAWCRGIPLAVLVLRGVLVTKGSLREWERFYESRTWGGEVYEKFIEKDMVFSYKELPYQLKPCFLYLATLAEDEEIDVETLFMLWDAEGMILSTDRGVGETMMDVAERYLGELVGRSLVEAELEDPVQHPNGRRRFKLCWLHDLMRKLCLSIVKKENFLEVKDYRGCKDKVVALHSSCPRNDTTTTPCRQVLYFSWEHEFIVRDDHKHEETRPVRSLMFKAGRARNLSKLKKMNFLRVLSFSDTSIGNEEFTNELIHLRYLSLNFCDIRKLPSSVYNLIYLQTLDMRARFQIGKDFVIIPNLALKKLKRLRHLFLPGKYDYEVTPNGSKLRLDGLTELETLVNVDSRMCEMKDVVELTNLRRLEWTVRISCEDDGEEFKEFMNKVYLDPSRQSSLAVDLLNPKVEMYSDALRGRLPEFCEGILRELEIRGVRGELLPEFSNFSQLTVLALIKFEVEKDPMPTLEKLSNLKDLTLLHGILKSKEMTCSGNGFPQLIDLTFHSLENWEKWRVEEGAMPNLQCLRIWKCPKLEMLPDELKFITTLEQLRIRYMPEEFKRRLIGGDAGEGEGEGPDFYKIRHLHGVDIR